MKTFFNNRHRSREHSNMATQPAVHAWPHARTNTRPSPRLTQTAFAVLLTLGASVSYTHLTLPTKA